MNNYGERDGLRYIMEQRWLSGGKDQFPSDLQECIETFKEIEKILNEKYHPLVNLGLAVKSGGLLTDHGPEHVKTVIKRAEQIIGEKHIDLLNGYEIFILLLAIHFHDLGNIYGRDEHEQKIYDVMEKMGKSLPLKTIDIDHIRVIAMAHGGYVDKEKTNKDTINILKSIDYRDSILIRPSVLAAILRFADEISEDFTRQIDLDIPPENEAYHKYSQSLEVNIKGNVISFRYRISYDDTQKKVQKDTSQIYLYDEIKLRLEKCLHELEYCRKYSEGFIGITTIKVCIYIISKDRRTQKLVDNFSLRLHGYPSKFSLDDFIERFDIDNNLLQDQKLKYATGEDLMFAYKEDS